MNEFAKFLEKKMNERNITARELGNELNVAQSYVYNWLRSQRIPTAKKNHLDMISKVLHLSLVELQELRESYSLSKEGNVESEKKSIISNILKMPMPLSNYNLESNKLMNDTYKIIEKNDFIEFLEIVLCNDGILDDGDNVYISCQEVFDIRYFNAFFEAVKKLLDRGVIINHLLPLKKDSLYNIKIFEKLIPLNLVKSKGNYITRYLTKYESESLTEIVYTKSHVAMFFNKGIIIHADKDIKELMKLEFESYINNTLNFLNRIDENTFVEKIKNMLSTKGTVYSTLGCRHYNFFNTFKENTSKLHNIFYENEILDVLTENLTQIPEGIESLEDFKYFLYESDTTIIIDDEYYSVEFPVYSIVKKDELILIFYINNEKVILSTSERIITSSFENFYKRIIYKYSGVSD